MPPVRGRTARGRAPRPVTPTGSSGSDRCGIARCGDDARSISSTKSRDRAQVVASWAGRRRISGGNRTNSPGIGTVGLQSAMFARPDVYPRVASVRCPPRRRQSVGDQISCHGRPHPGDVHEEEENTRASSSKPEAHRRTCGGRPRAGRLFVRQQQYCQQCHQRGDLGRIRGEFGRGIRDLRRFIGSLVGRWRRRLRCRRDDRRPGLGQAWSGLRHRWAG